MFSKRLMCPEGVDSRVTRIVERFVFEHLGAQRVRHDEVVHAPFESELLEIARVSTGAAAVNSWENHEHWGARSVLGAQQKFDGFGVVVGHGDLDLLFSFGEFYTSGCNARSDGGDIRVDRMKIEFSHPFSSVLYRVERLMTGTSTDLYNIAFPGFRRDQLFPLSKSGRLRKSAM